MARTRTLDLSAYDSIVDAFAQDLAIDVRYAVEIVSAAKAMEKKRKVWADRLEYRKAAKEGVTDKPSTWPPFPDGWALADAMERIDWALDQPTPREAVDAEPEPAPREAADAEPEPATNFRAKPRFARNGMAESGAGHGRRFSREEKARVVALTKKLRADNLSIKEIGSQLGISRSTVERYLELSEVSHLS